MLDTPTAARGLPVSCEEDDDQQKQGGGKRRENIVYRVRELQWCAALINLDPDVGSQN